MIYRPALLCCPDCGERHEIELPMYQGRFPDTCAFPGWPGLVFELQFGEDAALPDGASVPVYRQAVELTTVN